MSLFGCLALAGVDSPGSLRDATPIVALRRRMRVNKRSRKYSSSGVGEFENGSVKG
jgi:hypothetical protein